MAPVSTPAPTPPPATPVKKNPHGQSHHPRSRKNIKQSCLRCRSLLLLLLLLLLSRDLLLLRSRWSRSSRCSPEKYRYKICVKKYLKYSKSKISVLASISPPLLHIFSTTPTLRGRRRLQHLGLALGGPELRTWIFQEY